MQKHLITFAVGAAIVYASVEAEKFLNKPGTDGKKPLGDDVAKYGAFIGGGAALVLATHFISVGKG
jgi:hypothetical protein